MRRAGQLALIAALVLILVLQVVILCRQTALSGPRAETLPGQLGNRLELYLPGTVDVDTETDHSLLAGQLLRELAERYGGASSQAVRGCWIAGDGEPVWETTIVCFVYCPDGQLEAARRHFRELAAQLRDELGQECVAIVVNGVMEFI